MFDSDFMKRFCDKNFEVLEMLETLYRITTERTLRARWIVILKCVFNICIKNAKITFYNYCQTHFYIDNVMDCKICLKIK